MAYFGLTWFSSLFIHEPEGIAGIWPASGAALAAMLVTEKRRWPLLAGIAVVANVVTNTTSGMAIPPSLGFALVNAAEPLGVAAMLTAGGRAFRLERSPGVLRFAGAVLLGAAAAAAVGASLAALTFDAPWPSAWRQWLVADALGMVLAAPLVGALPLSSLRWRGWRALAEPLAVLLLTALITWGVFRRQGAPDLVTAWPYMVFPVLVYSAMRLSRLGSALVMLEVAAITVLATLADHGPFAQTGIAAAEQILNMQLFLSLAVLSTLLVSAVTAERTSALADLAEAEGRTRLILDTAQQAFVSVDADDRVVDWNPTAEKVFGWTREEALGLTAADALVPERLRTSYRRDFAEMLQAGGAARPDIRAEMMALHRDGHEVPVEVTGSPLVTSAGWRVNAFASDISDRKRAEDELRASETRFRALATQAPGGIYETRADGWCTFASERWCEVAGLTNEEALGYGWANALHPDDLSEVVAGWQQARESERDFSLEYRLVRPDGEVRWVHGTATPIKDEGGAVTGFIGVALDMTERKRTETDARLAGEIAANMAEGVCLVRLADDRIVFANRRFEEIFGYEMGELIGRGVDVLNAPGVEDPAAMATEIQKRVAERGAWHGEIHNMRKDGTVFWTQGNVSTFDHPEHGPVSVAIQWDVTEQKQAQTEAREAEARFRSAFEESPIGVALTSLDGRFVQVNHSLAEMVGYSVEDLQGRDYAAISHPDDVGRDEQALAELVAGKLTSHNGETRFIHASGHPVSVALSLNLIRDSDGEPSHLLAQMQDVTDRKRYEQKLQHMADHDPLTGLLNRRSFERELTAHVARSSRYGPEGALLMLDIDHFKYVNDTLGHNAGDAIIVRVAQAVRTALRESDVIARLGGDEFAVLLPKAGVDHVRVVVENLLEAVRGESDAASKLGPRGLSASVGVAMVTDIDGLTGEDLLVNADLAMYDAKEAGRDRMAVYSHEDRNETRMKGRVTWVQRIRTALDQDRFSLLAQPIVDLSTGRDGQYELLLRMRNESGDLIPPGAFLYIAERLDLVQDIDRWVVGRAMDILAERERAGAPLTLEVNLSGRSIGDASLVSFIEERLADSRIDASRLIFEITETAAVSNIAAAREFAEQLSEMGCRFALDDFGAGFGSFYYLKHLPFDILKIDGEFVRNCRTSATDRLVIGAVVEIAKGLGKQTIGEFVEDDETARLLTRLGVDYGQGFHLGVPAPVELLLEPGSSAAQPVRDQPAPRSR